MKVRTFNILMKVSSITTIATLSFLIASIVIFIILVYGGVDLSKYGKIMGIIYAIAFGITFLLMVIVKLIFIIDKRRNKDDV